MHYRFSASRVTTLRLSSRSREDYLSSAVGLFLAGSRYFDTALYCSATDFPSDGTSQSDSMRSKWYREELLGWETGARPSRYRQ